MAQTNAAAAWPEIVALGEPMIEFNQTDPDSPNYVQGFGGDVSNMAIAAARQGARVGVITRVGADPFGDLLMTLWQSEGVDTRAVVRDPDAHRYLFRLAYGARPCLPLFARWQRRESHQPCHTTARIYSTR